MTDQAPSRSLVIAAGGGGAVDRIDFRTEWNAAARIEQQSTSFQEDESPPGTLHLLWIPDR